MSVSLGANSRNTGLSFSQNRKIVKTSTGKLVLFIIDDTNSKIIEYKTSTDEGTTWDSSWTQLSAHTHSISYSAVYLDSSTNNIYICFLDGYDGSPRFVKLTYSAGTWTPGSFIQVTNLDTLSGSMQIIRRGDGNLWIVGVNGSTSLFSYYSTDDGATWTRISPKTILTSDPKCFTILAVGTEVWAIYRDMSSNLNIYKYTTSWDSGVTISSGNITTETSLEESSIGVGKVSDSEIYVAGKTASGIKVYKYNGSTWDSGTLVSTNANDESPAISIVNGKPWIVFRYYDGANYNVGFVFWNGINWTTKLNITTGSPDKHSPTVLESDTIYCNVGWNSGASTPYTVYFKSVLIVTSVSDISNKITTVILHLSNISNKFNFVKQLLSHINNKINTAIRILSDVNNFINICKAIVSDIINDFRTKKLTLNNITNDIRFLYDWQKAADGGLQSLGKEYITVSIGGVPQTDIDVDSVSISKDLSSAHTASFDLARAYDASKPAMEAIVIIKYNDWVLFTGYITQISPADDPEKIRINCQDEYWKQNKTNVYYNVGHKPVDDKELYYNTLAEALTTQHSWTPRIGNFVPESLTNFAVGKSDAISNLIKEMGNYEWFYDVDGTKKLWTAGQGSIIELERQTLGENIKLYDVINHSFEEDVENIVNKLRVQMGDKVIQKDNRNRTYTGYNYSSYHQFVTPAWDGSLELLSIQTASGYGLDHPNPIYSAEYSLVFKKYKMPYLDPKVSSWSDAHPPYVEIYSAGGYLGFVGPLHLQLEKVLKEGFTIDYENATITFNEPYFLYKTDANGQCIAVRAPIVKVFLWKKNYYTNTSSPSDDPETDISNPLMFFTDKMGTYLDTIIEDLNLSNLSIQEGYIQHDYLTGEDIVIPSWNDTEFAIDYANWQLSKTCDKKIKGNISITLDATCFYNIDLSKRVYIDGITDSPMNIIGMTYNISSFTVSLQLENSRYYNRSISIQSHGE